MRHAWFLLFLTAPPFASAAPQESREEADYFEKKIRPILADHCFECHSGQAKKPKGDLRLDTREGILKGGQTGPAVVPGDPGKSLLLRAVEWTDDDFKMPPRKKLPREAIGDLAAWIRRGAPVPELTPASGGGLRAAGPHWAFQGPQDPKPPAVRQPEQAAEPLDRFVLARLEEKGVEPSPPADPRTLLRRVSFDLVGLPPTSEELEAFLGDPSPEAWARAVDRLLASPRYGERWGRHWLDVARYADTTDGMVDGKDDPRLVNSSIYRDWVVRAFNDDLPYDQFLLKQLAADLLPPDHGGPELEALGFLTLGRRFENNVHDIIDERLDVVGRGLLGLTLSCARCHDHKFDPIPTEDYYSLYGVFAAQREKVVSRGKSGTADYREELERRKQVLRDYRALRGAEVQAHVRGRIREYLLALAEAPAPGLDPLLVAHLKSYLGKTKKESHPVFGLWHRLWELPDSEWLGCWAELLGELGTGVSPGIAAEFLDSPPRSRRDLAQRYGRLLEEAGGAGKGRTDLEDLRAVLEGSRAIPVLASKPESVSEEFFSNGAGYEIAYLKARIARWEVAAPGAPERAFVLEEIAPKGNPRVFKRGNPEMPGEEVPRRFLGALEGEPRRPFAQGSGRLDLARAIASRQNPLTARVWVNRVFMHHFGAGLVATPSDFGHRSDPPSNPELLDWLATRFVSDWGWSTKRLHRQILISSTYRQASLDRPEARRIDPENRLLWKMNARRLDFEAMRDSLLAVSGQLDPGAGGPADVLTSQPYSRRRSVYGFVDRLNLSGVLMSFDFANPTAHAPGRHLTTVPQQALFMMNSPFMREQGEGLGRRLERFPNASAEDRIRLLYRWLFGRAPTAGEISSGARFVREAGLGGAIPATSPWSYGYGEYDPARGRTKGYTPLPCFTGDAWQTSPYLPDAGLGWLMLDATGGYPGEDLGHAAIRRWTAPADGSVSIEGTVKLLYDPDTYKGRIRVRIVSSRLGPVATETVASGEVPLGARALSVKRGDEIDFIAECPDQVAYARFGWAPVIRMGGRVFSSEADFEGPSERPPGPWDRYAQVLLATNEFVFVD